MNQQKTGWFLRELRREQQLTQAQLAEKMGVSNRTVSRWENGVNMPDFDLLIEMADFYGVDVREILDGERRSKVDVQRKEDLLSLADYTNQEKQRLANLMRALFLAGLLAMGGYMLLNGREGYEFLSSFLLGGVTGVLLLGVLYTSKYMMKVREFKLRLLARRGKEKKDEK